MARDASALARNPSDLFPSEFITQGRAFWSTHIAVRLQMKPVTEMHRGPVWSPRWKRMMPAKDATSDLIVTIRAAIRDYEELEDIISEMVQGVRDKDPATIQYSFSIDDQKETLFVLERYSDANGFLAHIENMGPIAARYLEKVEVIDAAVHVAPGTILPLELQQALAAFGTSIMTYIDRLDGV